MSQRKLRADLAKVLKAQLSIHAKPVLLSLDWVDDTRGVDRLATRLAEVAGEQIGIAFSFREIEGLLSVELVSGHAIEAVLRNAIAAESTLALVDPASGDSLVVNVDAVDTGVEFMASAQGKWESVLANVAREVPGSKPSANKWVRIERGG